MQTAWLFWTVAAVLVLGTLAAVFAPLLRRRASAERRASYDMQVYRDQLREIDADRDRGVLSESEAQASRVEVSRRLLAAADAEAAETAAARAPRRVSAPVAWGATAALALAAAGLYAGLGAPLLPDQPLAARLERQAEERANRPTQAVAEAMVAGDAEAAPPAAASPEDLALLARLQAVLAERPDDLQGHRLLARSLGTLGRWAEAAAAQARVVELTEPEVDPQALVDWAELMILAVGGYVSPEAEAALARALALDAQNPVGRYYSGLALLQGGRPDLAYRLWSGLLVEGPADAPWVASIERDIDEVARLAGQPPPPRAQAPAGPTRTEIEDAQGMEVGDRGAMIEGMVARLSDRLATEGGPPEDWAQLVRSLGVLGRSEDAAAILAEARHHFAQNPAALDLLTAAAREAGLGP